MKLYCTKRSPYARKARVIAIEKGVDLEIIEEDLKNKSSQLMESNPIGRVPVLEIDEGMVLCDSTLICDYLNTLNNSPSLLPLNPIQALEIRNLDLIAKGMIDVTVSHFYENLRHPENTHQSFLADQEETIQRTLKYFDQHVGLLKDLSLGSISLACAIGYIIFRTPHLWPQEDCKELTAWYEKISQRESLKQTIPEG